MQIKLIVVFVLSLLIVGSVAAQQKKDGSDALAHGAPAGDQKGENESPNPQETDAGRSLPTNTSPPTTNSNSRNDRSIEKHLLSDFEFWLSAEILLFGFGVLLAEFLLLRKGNITAEEALRVYAVSLIIIGTLFAITAGFDANQIAPAMGLFGTIAGYLLGKREADTKSKGKQDDHEAN